MQVLCYNGFLPSSGSVERKLGESGPCKKRTPRQGYTYKDFVKGTVCMIGKSWERLGEASEVMQV